MRLPEEPDEPLQLNIVPMIDVIFAILAFFVVSTLYLTRSEGIPVDLPTAASADVQISQQLVVSIDRQGQLFIQQTPIDLDSLELEVRSRLQTGSSVVIINADKATPHGQVVAVMDRLRTLEGVRLAIATDPASLP
ncbi:MAG: biopolymer transporter ExbD [Synechococcales cyanobacterium T60_A2020_003]|nr:biopolymer transporter ExbD [Synechococcales cyanobacterium T60_A2020_003]